MHNCISRRMCITVTAATAVLIQHNVNASCGFRKSWNEFRDGFSNSDGTFWLGNDNIHRMTSNATCQLYLRISMEKNVVQYGLYSTFSVGENSTGYKISIQAQGSSGNLTYDALPNRNGQRFSTYDNDEDGDQGNNCASVFQGGWWFTTGPTVAMAGFNGSCGDSNVNGGPSKFVWYDGKKTDVNLLDSEMWLMCV